MNREKAVEELRAELAPELYRLQQRGAETELAKLATNPYAQGLPTDKIIERLDLVRWFRNGQRVFFKKSEESHWNSGVFLDFNVPGLKARVLIRDQGNQDQILIVDPDEAQLVSRVEKTQLQLDKQVAYIEQQIEKRGAFLERELEKQSNFLKQQLEGCRTLLSDLRGENARVKSELARERKRCSALLAASKTERETTRAKTAAKKGKEAKDK